ncbi:MULTISPECIES: hypothetical protein [Wolbachia]|uniref:Uncharacterized protein n=1 Tax=Wolbachia pipientis TaxID=955 RepID=A0A7G5CCS4_WOLPI|nr:MULTISPECIES: hypothetical protein [Wolbachia]MDE5060872.1 hypothetical protein [Wolbachia endosymbiont of Drosophila nikananu]QMV47008.1 hypothetical protein HC356_02910 [Wolbachia pipientis]
MHHFHDKNVLTSSLLFLGKVSVIRIAPFLSSQCPSNKDNIANLEFKRVIPRELLRQKAGVEFVYNVDLGGFYE